MSCNLKPCVKSRQVSSQTQFSNTDKKKNHSRAPENAETHIGRTLSGLFPKQKDVASEME